MQLHYFRICFSMCTTIKKIADVKGSSLFYNTSARHERQECGISDRSAIRVRHEQHKCDTIATRTARVWHKWKFLILINTRVKTYFHTPSYIANEKLQEEEQFHSKNCLLEISRMKTRYVWKMRLKSAQQKLDL